MLHSHKLLSLALQQLDLADDIFGVLETDFDGYSRVSKVVDDHS